jgi:nitrite reductase/ring-hydroxylating ferredoxin subunit
MVASAERLVRAARLSEVEEAGCRVVHVDGRALALFSHEGAVYAVENRCPHMGFPLHRGSVKDGILTCHWHHARFDLASGGTFDQWADDVLAFPTRVQDGEVWIDLTPGGDPRAHQRERLRVGLERNISLVIAKAVILLLDRADAPVEPFRIGLDFGTHYRRAGWSQGLTMLGCFLNLVPQLDPEDRPRALYQGLAATARDCDGMAPRFLIQPLPTDATDLPTLKRWFRRFIEVRDAEGAERCVVSAVRAGASGPELADMLFAAVTDHRYISIGHPADFTNKALEALDATGWDRESTESALTSLARGYAEANRMEESNSWRNPVDLIALLEGAFTELPAALAAGSAQQGQWHGQDALLPVILGEDPATSIAGLLDALRAGCTPEELASLVAYAAALRIARFHTSNEFGDWDTALHTFTFANAIHQGLRRAPSAELLRGVFDAAMSTYLDRFLNIPAARIPEPGETNGTDPAALLDELPTLLDRQQQVNEAGELVARYLHSGGDPDRLIALLGKLLLREDRDFHTIQMIEAAARQFADRRGTPAGTHVLVAAARYLAAHAPTMRAQGQTYQIAQRLYRGERLFEEE